MTLTCWTCKGMGWIRTYIKLPARIYGQERTVEAAKPCPSCHTQGKITTATDPKAVAANYFE